MLSKTILVRITFGVRMVGWSNQEPKIHECTHWVSGLGRTAAHAEQVPAQPPVLFLPPTPSCSSGAIWPKHGGTLATRTLRAPSLATCGALYPTPCLCNPPCGHGASARSSAGHRVGRDGQARRKVEEIGRCLLIRRRIHERGVAAIRRRKRTELGVGWLNEATPVVRHVDPRASTWQTNDARIVPQTDDDRSQRREEEEDDRGNVGTCTNVACRTGEGKFSESPNTD